MPPTADDWPTLPPDRPPEWWAPLLDHQAMAWAGGGGPPTELYVERYPELAGCRDAVVDLVAAEYDCRKGFGGPPAEAYAARFPHLAAEVRESIAFLENLDADLAPVALPAGYRFLAHLGRGGMASVYLADASGHKVAVKVPHPSPHAERTAARFEDEVRAVLSLRHDGICRIVGHSSLPPRFLAMEYVEGETLADRIAKGPLSSAEAARTAVAVAQALGYAHDRGVTHRDVKPSNVMLRTDGRAVVLDFGVAAFREDARALTGTGEIPGSLPYTSPERHRGETATPAADVWGLGAVLFEMLTGRRMFEGNQGEVVLSIVDGEYPDPAQFNPAVPPALVLIVRRATDRDPARRHPTMAALAGDLERFLSGDVATPPRRRWRAVALVAALATVAVAVLAGLFGRTPRPADEPPAAKTRQADEPPAKSRPALSPGEQLRAIKDHLDKQAPADRLAFRYVVLPAGVTGDEWAGAVNTLLNALHWRANPATAEPLGPHGNPLAIDLRALGWDAAGGDGRTRWDRLMAAYPYALTPGAKTDDETRRLSRQVAEWVRDETPVVRADWLVANAAAAPLYAGLLDMPPTLAGLADRLGASKIPLAPGRAATQAGFLFLKADGLVWFTLPGGARGYAAFGLTGNSGPCGGAPLLGCVACHPRPGEEGRPNRKGEWAAVTDLARRHGETVVTAAIAAAELNLAPDALAGAVADSARLREIGLESLAAGGTVARTAWEGADPQGTGSSVFQIAARELRAGVPYRRPR
ncbi:serine/threonine-protein kinase [Limnoglobus roseus]|uniref:Serine/threonine protein kinase n=1 Tax=Limnoglobus roseus TaxID=2598579 RepID=A0A5C1AV36_9BACT|nr:serine/threonine-protein kinase [Limnoglobus roseus]QEL20668.1 serine/threonine protein kinase [Limnoglobus roseus]